MEPKMPNMWKNGVEDELVLSRLAHFIDDVGDNWKNSADKAKKLAVSFESAKNSLSFKNNKPPMIIMFEEITESLTEYAKALEGGNKNEKKKKLEETEEALKKYYDPAAEEA